MMTMACAGALAGQPTAGPIREVTAGEPTGSPTDSPTAAPTQAPTGIARDHHPANSLLLLGVLD